jgi:hypothetical protein
MRGGERRHAENVHVVLDGLACRLGRASRTAADVDVEAEVGEGRGDHLLAAVVAVLADLGDQDARPAALVGSKAVTSFSTRATRRIMPTSRLKRP